MSVRVEGFGLVFDKLDLAAAEEVVRDARRYAAEFDEDEPRRRVERSGEWDDHMIEMRVTEEGRTVGSVQARRCEKTMFPGIFEIGMNLFSPDDRGRGLGRRVTALVSSYLFDEKGARRVQLTTDLANAPMRAVAERLGFTYEGTLRGFALTDEGQRDYALYAITRDDYLARRQLWTSTD